MDQKKIWIWLLTPSEKNENKSQTYRIQSHFIERVQLILKVKIFAKSFNILFMTFIIHLFLIGIVLVVLYKQTWSQESISNHIT